VKSDSLNEVKAAPLDASK
ncbi:hypothetical protein, partial [Faecalibacillus intestinalis]